MKHRLRQILTMAALAAAAMLALTAGASAAQYVYEDGTSVAVGYNSGQNAHYYTLDGNQLTLKRGQILIEDEIDFWNFRDFVNFHGYSGGESQSDYAGVTWKLTKDLDLTKTSFEPVGKSGNQFGGTFDGDNKTITLPNISDESSGAVGLFGYANWAIIQNLTVSGSGIVNQIESTNNSTGGIVGEANKCTISNCTVKELSITGTQNVGGVVGMAFNCTIEGCMYTTTLETLPAATATQQKAGGIAGFAQSTTIVGCSNECRVQVADINKTGNSVAGDVGGIVGLCAGGGIQSCENRGPVVTQEGNRAGGIVGKAEAVGLIKACINTADVFGKHHIGGIAGQLSGSNSQVILGCCNLGNVDASKEQEHHAGGIAGNASGSVTFQKCYHGSGFVTADVTHPICPEGVMQNCFGDMNVKENGNNRSGYIVLEILELMAYPTPARLQTLGWYRMPSSEKNYPVFDENLQPAEFTIFTADDWDVFAELVSSRDNSADIKAYLRQSIKLGQDGSYTPIGTRNKPFRGLLESLLYPEGKPFTITLGSSDCPVTGGLFDYLADGAEISHVGVDATISYSGNGNVGILANNVISVNSDRPVEIDYCTTEGSITTSADNGAGQCVGGMVGSADRLRLKMIVPEQNEPDNFCVNRATVISTAENVGGLVGKSIRSELDGTNAGNVTYTYKSDAECAYLGGVVGYAGYSTYIFGQNAATAVTMDIADEEMIYLRYFYAGGIAGGFEGGAPEGVTKPYIKSDVYNTAAVTGACYSGKSVGYWISGDVWNLVQKEGSSKGSRSADDAVVGLASLTMSYAFEPQLVKAAGQEEIQLKVDNSGNLVMDYAPDAVLKLRVEDKTVNAETPVYLTYPTGYQVTCVDAFQKTHSPDALPEGAYTDDCVSFSGLPIGVYTITITGQGGYYGEVTKTLKVVGLTAEVKDTFDRVYTGVPIVPGEGDITFYYDGEVVEGVSFEVVSESEEEYVNAGEVTLPILVNGTHSGITTVTYTIGKRPLALEDVAFYQGESSVTALTYNGQEQSFYAKVIGVNKESLDGDVTITYLDADQKELQEGASDGKRTALVTNTGTYTARIEAKETSRNYTGTVSKPIEMEPRSIQTAEIKLPDMVFNGGQHDAASLAEVKLNGVLLKYGVDYTAAAYKDSFCETPLEQGVQNAGPYYLLVKGQGNYDRSLIQEYWITPAEVTYDNTFIMKDRYVVLNGDGPAHPVLQFPHEAADHFEVTYENDDKPGTAYITVRALDTAVNYRPGSEIKVAYTILADGKDRIQAMVEKVFEAAPAGTNTFELAVGGSEVPAGVYNLPAPARDTPCRYVTVRKMSISSDAPQTTVTDTTEYRPGVPVYLRADTQYMLEFHY